jgi:hypothetical protein
LQPEVARFDESRIVCDFVFPGFDVDRDEPAVVARLKLRPKTLVDFQPALAN